MQRVGLRVVRSLGIGIWRLGERLGINLIGANEAPRTAADDTRTETFERLIAVARAGDGTVASRGAPFRRTSC